jgi:hypothetical protein
MKRVLVVVVILLGVWKPVARAQQGSIEMSPVPFWPPTAEHLEQRPGQFVFFDPVTREWVVSYPEDMTAPQTSQKVEVRFGRASEVKPVVSAHVERRADGSYSYSYVVQNDASARNPVARWTLLVPVGDESFRATHANWGASRNEAGNPTVLNPGARRLAELHWTPPNANALLRAGDTVGPFSITSSFPPGFTVIAAKGRISREYTPEIAASLPPAAAAQLSPFLEPAWDSAIRITLGPWFHPDESIATIAANFQYGMSVLVDQQALDANSVFVKSALSAFETYLASDAATVLDPNRMDFLSKAAPGLETEIANALRLTLARE